MLLGATPCSETAEGFSGQPREHPLFRGLSTEPPIKAERLFVPVEHRPLHPPAAAPPRDPRQLAEERTAGAVSALFREHEEIFQVERRATHERRVREEIEGEPDGLATPTADDRFEVAAPAKAVAPDLACCRDRLVGQALVLGEPADQLEDHRNVASRAAADREG